MVTQKEKKCKIHSTKNIKRKLCSAKLFTWEAPPPQKKIHLFVVATNSSVSVKRNQILPVMDVSGSVWHPDEDGACLPVLPLCSQFGGHTGEFEVLVSSFHDTLTQLEY